MSGIGTLRVNDTNIYEQLEFEPTELHTEKIKSGIKNIKNENLLDLKTVNSLLKEKIKIPEFHLLPKIHKADNPVRIVISSINTTLIEFQNLLIITHSPR